MALWIQRWLNEIRQKKNGQALVEYALILALIAVVVVGAIYVLGNHVGDTLNNVNNSLNG